jgi:hypothetical protein
MGALSNKRNLLAAVVVVVLALIMIYVNFVAPAREERRSKAAQLVQKQKELQALQRKTEGVSSLGAEELVALSATRGKIPEVPDLEGLLREVRLLETASRMSFAGYNFEVDKAPGTAGASKNAKPAAAAGEEGTNANLAVPIRISTTLKGDYEQIQRLLDEVQTSERLLQVDKLIFNVKTTAPVKLNMTKRPVDVQITLKAYYAPGLQRFFKSPVPVDYSKPQGRTNPIY